MKRIIKFRTWYINSEKMQYDPIGKLILNDSFDSSGAIYTQFTGLLDKNGKEIYEGDIVISGIEKMDVYYEPGIIQPFYSYGANDREWEVIGNIYENPKLLK